MWAVLFYLITPTLQATGVWWSQVQLVQLFLFSFFPPLFDEEEQEEEDSIAVTSNVSTNVAFLIIIIDDLPSTATILAKQIVQIVHCTSSEQFKTYNLEIWEWHHHM